MTTEIVIAGFGGQGVLFAGKVLANCAMLDGLDVSWLPSYGPEMRGGTANCSVCISDDPIGSPVISTPDCLIALNEPSYYKFIKSVKPHGSVFIDSSIVKGSCERNDIEFISCPASDIAADIGHPDMANMVLIGKMLAKTGLFTLDIVKAALGKCIPAKREHLLSYNIKAVTLGMN